MFWKGFIQHGGVEALKFGSRLAQRNHTAPTGP